MRNTIVFILALIILSAALYSCAHTAMPGPQNPVTLNMWHVYGSQTKSPLNTVIDEFNSTVGREHGITINIVSVTTSSAIDKALAASANGEPGAEAMPDLFTAYPRVVEIVNKDTLLAWNDYFTEKELAAFHAEFLSEGYFENELLILPIAKSTEAFYLNKTVFDRFSADTGISVDTLNTFDGVFEAARKYYDWSGGQNFMQINDYYNYAFVGMKAYGGELVINGSLRLDDDAFKKIWEPLAQTAIYGGICLEDGYAASRWTTAEIIANTGSSADVLYQPTEIVHPDNTTVPLESVSLPYPTFTDRFCGAIYRGGGLLALKSENERKNQAAYIFAKWLTDTEHNLDFVTHAGYLPVTDDAFETLFADFGIVETESYRGIYQTVDKMFDEYSFFALPVYHGASDIQLGFEANVKAVLKAAHIQYKKRLAEGEDPASLMTELVDSTLSELKSLSE